MAALATQGGSSQTGSAEVCARRCKPGVCEHNLCSVGIHGSLGIATANLGTSTASPVTCVATTTCLRRVPAVAAAPDELGGNLSSGTKPTSLTGASYPYSSTVAAHATFAPGERGGCLRPLLPPPRALGFVAPDWSPRRVLHGDHDHTPFVVVARTATVQVDEDTLSNALTALVGGTRPRVSVADVQDYLRRRFDLADDEVDVRHHFPEDFIVRFRHGVDKDRVL